MTLEALEERLAPAVVPLSLAPTQRDEAEQLVHVNFAGARDVTYRGPVVVEGIDVPAFAADGYAEDEDFIVAATLDELAARFADRGVRFTTDAPADGSLFSTVYVGGTDATFRAYGRFLGLAEKVDAGNADRGDNAFVFSEHLARPGLSAEAFTDALADVIAHEVEHLLGAAHEHHESEGPLAEVAFAQGGDDGEHPEQTAHQWFSRQGYEYFTDQFGRSELTDFVGVVGVYPGGPNTGFIEGTFDEDVPYENPWGHGGALLGLANGNQPFQGARKFNGQLMLTHACAIIRQTLISTRLAGST